MTTYIESHNRVFAVTMVPDTPGRCRRTITATLVSGPPLTVEEYERVSKEVVADTVALGVDVISWGGEPNG